MEPQLPPVGFPVERAPVANGELVPNANSPNLPDVAPIGSPEQAGNIEVSSGDARGLAAPIAQPPAVITSQPTAPAPVTTAVATVADGSTPTTAADDDLIEKEWIAKAKQVVQATKSDPHAQASQISQLMVDYVLKRYGKEVGKA